MYPKKIEKEEIPNLRLTPYEVSNDVVLINSREQALRSAAILGNTEKQKCKIVFNTDEGSCAVGQQSGPLQISMFVLRADSRCLLLLSLM